MAKKKKVEITLEKRKKRNPLVVPARKRKAGPMSSQRKPKKDRKPRLKDLLKEVQ